MIENNIECVQCGYCCHQTPCGYGKAVSNEEPACIFLEIADPSLGTFKCGKYAKILRNEAETIYPMFGCGCLSSLFNTVRQAVIEKMI